MPGRLEAVPQVDMSGGENLVASPFDVAPNQVLLGQNVLLDEHGSMRTRDGTLIQGAQSPQSTQPIVKVYDLVRVSGLVTRLSIVQGPVQNTLYDRGATPWTSLGVFSQNYALPDIVTWLDEAIIAAGNTEQIRVFQSPTFSVATGNAPSASHIAVHLSYLWAWNTNNATTATAGPSSLQASDINTVTSWNIANQTFVAKDDGSSGQGLGVFTIAEAGISPTVTIICFKDFSAYEVTGTFAANSLSVQKVKSDQGCIAPRTIQFISGFGLIRLSHRGFGLYDGVNDTLISEEIRPLIFGRDAITGLDFNHISLSYASQVPNPPLYVCLCPVSGAPLTRMFVYDLVRKAWTHATFANSLATVQLLVDPNALPTILGGDYNAGYVRRYFQGDITDDGSAITALLRPRPVTGQTPMDRVFVKRLLVETAAMTANTTVLVNFSYGANQQTVTQTTKNLSASVMQAGWGQQPWGNFPWGSATLLSNVTNEETLTFDALGGIIANSVFADLTWTGAGKIRGVEWQRKVKPLTRSVTGVPQ